MSQPPRARVRASPSCVLAVLLSVCWIGLSADADAQEPVREVQVPVDTAGTVLEITPEIRRAAGLFPEVEMYEAARLFRQSNGVVVLEIAWREGGRLVRERRVLDMAALDRLQQAVQSALPELDRVRSADQGGRGGLVWRSTGLGLGFYGWAVPYAMDMDDARAAVATYLLTAAASFYLPYRATRDRRVTDAHRSFALWGATRGALYGGALGYGVADPDGSSSFDDGDEEWRLGLGLATIGSMGLGVLGFKAVDWTGVDQGTADLWGMWTDFATGAGFATAFVSGLYDDETRRGADGVPVIEEADPLLGNLVAVGASALGFSAAWAMAPRGTFSVGDVSVLRSFGLLGAQSLLPVANLLVDRDSEKVHVAATVLGAAPGLWLGHRLLQNQDFSDGDGLLVAAGHLAGGLLGAGITFLVDPDTDRDALIYLTTTTAGSAAGLALTYRALSGDGARASSVRGLGDPDPGDGRGGVRVTVDPTGLLPVLMGGGTDSRPFEASLLSLRW